MTAYLTALSESATREELLSEVARQQERAERAEAQRDAAVEALKQTVRSLMFMSVEDLPADNEERWWELPKFAAAYPLTYGPAHRVLSSQDAASLLQRREREKAVIEAARKCVPPNGAKAIGGDPGSGALRALHTALASLDTEGDANAD